MGNRIISISRQFGSGGHEVAVKTADLLGIRVYERELIRLACEYGELSEKTLSPSDEKATNPYLFQTVHEGNHHVLRGKPTSEVLFALQSHEIRRIARHEECVFVGRCADYVLRGEDVRASHCVRRRAGRAPYPAQNGAGKAHARPSHPPDPQDGQAAPQVLRELHPQGLGRARRGMIFTLTPVRCRAADAAAVIAERFRRL